MIIYITHSNFTQRGLFSVLLKAGYSFQSTNQPQQCCSSNNIATINSFSSRIDEPLQIIKQGITHAS